MIEIVKNIFQKEGFIGVEANSFTLFSYSDKTSYWIVKEAETLDFLDKQDNIFIKAKELAKNNPKFDKNASLLLLYKIEEGANLKVIKKQILEIEEDPYQFKKQVLIYSELAKKALDSQLSKFSFCKLLSSQETFRDYKDNYTESSWQALLFRIAQKLPFIEIEVEKNKNLSSLFQRNQTALTNKGFDDINKKIEEAFNRISVSDIKNMDSDVVFDLLLTEEEKENGIEDK